MAKWDDKAIGEKRRRAQGCYGNSAIEYKLENFIVKTCIGNLVSPNVLSYMEMYHAYKNGVMPCNGSFGEQNAKIIELFQVIDTMVTEKRNEATEKEKRRRR
jgi:hypothetical protein